MPRQTPSSTFSRLRQFEMANTPMECLPTISTDAQINSLDQALMYLYNHMTYLTGTTLSNRVGLPEPIRQKLVKKCDAVNYRRRPLLACAFEEQVNTYLKGKQKTCDSWVCSSVQQVHGWCRHENLLLSR